MRHVQITFRISDRYDEQELEELLQTIEVRGAIYFFNSTKRYYEAWVPETHCEAFFQRVLECESVLWVALRNTGTEVRRAARPNGAKETLV